MTDANHYPTLSVVVNNYNYGDYLEQALDSALEQMQDGDELIVVDDGSTDNSAEILEQYVTEHGVKFIAQQNQGQMKSVRTGVLAARSDVIVLLDSDDYFLEGYLERLRKIYRNNTDVSFVLTSPEIGGEDPAHAASMRKLVEGMAFETGPVGPTKWATLIFNEYVGVPTSGISLHRSLSDKVMSLPETIDATARLSKLQRLIFGISKREAENSGFNADNVITRTTSVLDAVKYCDNTPGFMYRIHGTNKFASLPWRARRYLRAHQKRILNSVFCEYFSISLPPTTAELHDEILRRSWGKKLRRKLRIRLEYCLAIVKSRGKLGQKLAATRAALGLNFSG